MKLSFFLLSFALLSSCTTVKKSDAQPGNQLLKDVEILSSDAYEGRKTNTKGAEMAREYLASRFKAIGLKSFAGKENFEHPFSFELSGTPVSGKNMIGYIEGNMDSVIVISAHYDHVGMKNGEVYNGADDDGSGTVALLEIAQAFMQAKKDGYGPKRSILFLHVTGEEHGLHGSRYYSENPLFPIKNTIADLNIDMIGRRDEEHKDNGNYVYVIGSDRLSTDLHNINEEANKKYTDLKLDYTFNDKNDPNHFYERSDHYNFAKKGIPIIFYFNGVHEDYHQPGDEVGKIDFPMLAKRAKLVYFTAWELANGAKRPVVDKNDDGSIKK